MICPWLMTMSNNDNCIKEKCAWWVMRDSEHSECAIKTIAEKK